jgi:aconitate hydratase
MGVLPLQFKPGDSVGALGLTGRETCEIVGAAGTLTPRSLMTVRATADDGSVKTFEARLRIDTPEEVVAFRNGGILPYVLRQLVQRR